MIKMKWIKGCDGLVRFFYVNTETNSVGGLCYAKDFREVEVIIINTQSAQDLINEIGGNNGN